MVEEAKKTDTNTKTQLSLAAALFFAPLVHYILRRTKRNLSESDTLFVSSYIKLGYLHLFLGIITILASTLQYFLIVSWVHTLYIASIALLITLLMMSIVCILADISILHGNTFFGSHQPLSGNKKDIILKFLPIYNVYLRYDAHNFASPNRWIKESLLWRGALALVSMTGIVWLTTIILLCIILRVAALMSDIDFFPLSLKRIFNNLFTKNPEEIRGYLLGSLLYGYHFLTAFITRTSLSPNFRTDIITAKDLYSSIIDIHASHHLIIREYLIGSVLIVIGLFIIPFTPPLWTYYVGGVLILARYILMVSIRKHLPHLPLAREIVAGISWIIGHFIHPTSSSHE